MSGREVRLRLSAAGWRAVTGEDSARLPLDHLAELQQQRAELPESDSAEAGKALAEAIERFVE